MDSIHTGSSKKQSNKEKTTNLSIDNELIHNNKDNCIVDSNTSNSCNIINKKKWLCSQCTYENWPSALKCTICLTSKSANTYNPSVNNQINSKLKPCHVITGHNNNANQNDNPRSNKLNNNNRNGTAKKRHDSNNRNSIKSYESKIKLKFESSNKSNEFTKQSVGEQCSETNWYSSSSSNENLNENSTISLSNVKAVAKSKKKGTLSNDIYKIGNILSKNANDLLINKEELKGSITNQDDSALNQSIETQKWSCQACTYLNWPKSIKCIQCYTSKAITAVSIAVNSDTPTHHRTQINPTPSNVSLNNLPHFSESASIQTFSSSEQLLFANTTGNDSESSSSNKNLTKITNTAITTLNINNESKNLTDIRSLCNSPCTVPKAPESDQKGNCEKIEVETVEVNVEKLSGPCQSDNSTTETAIDNDLENTVPTNKTSVNNKENEQLKKWSCSSCTYQNWPKSQYCTMCHVKRVNTAPMTNQNSIRTTNKTNTIVQKCNNTNNISTKMVSSSSGTSSKKASYNLLKTLQIQMDRLFLSACEGVVDADMTHLHRYINAGGDITRYLNSDEVKLLNRPNIFTVGQTLLHLCYQFNRTDFLMKLLNKQSSVQQQQQQQKRVPLPNEANKKSTRSSPINLLNVLLKKVNTKKFSPCQSCPTLASNIIDRYFSASLRYRKTQNRDGSGHQQRSNNDLGAATNATLLCHQNSPTSSLISLNSCNNQAFLNLSPSPSPPPFSFQGGNAQGGATSLTHNSFLSQCFYVNECHTFILPNEIDDFSPRIQHILFDELLDREVQQELENESRVINWNIDLIKRLNSRLYPLWNRHSGDCLLDSVLQACYGVFDTDNTLRHVMAESLEQYANCFKPRWKEHEIIMAHSMEYTLDDYQLEQDWNNILALARQPGSSLEQAHIFALCHIFRRPIIIYSIKYVKSFRGENIGFTHFEGVYLPLIWEPSFCFKSPIALGYTRGHFTALVPLERNDVVTYTMSNSNVGAVSQLDNSEQNQQIFYLPLANNEGQLLPVHFLNSSEVGRERSILRQYLNLDCLVMQGSNCGLFVAQQRVAKRGMLVNQMLDEWLSYYRNMQMKEIGQQIEISTENEQSMYPIRQQQTYQQQITLKNNEGICNNTNGKNSSSNVSNKNHSVTNQIEDDDLEGDESDDDDDDDDDDDEEDDEDDDEEANNQGI